MTQELIALGRRLYAGQPVAMRVAQAIRAEAERKAALLRASAAEGAGE